MISQSIRTLESSFLGMLIVFVTIFSFTPIIDRAIILLGLEALFLFVIFSQIGNSQYALNSRLTMSVILYLAVCVSYKLLNISSLLSGQLVIHVFFFIAILVMLLIPCIITNKQSEVLVWLIVGVVVFNIIDNIRLCILYPEVALAVNRDSEFEYLGINIGSSRFYNGVFFFYTVCLFGFLNLKKKVIKFLMLVAAGTAAVFILGFCLKASVFVFFILATFLLILGRRAKSFKSFFFRIAIPSLVAFFLVSEFTNEIIEFITKSFPSERLASRLIYLIDSDSAASGAEATVKAREELGMVSLRTWTDNIVNFFVGIGDHRVIWGEQSAASSGIGQHAEFLDSLARYGLIGFFLLWNILYGSFKYITRLFDQRYFIQLQIIFLLFILFGLSKGVFFPNIGVVLFLFLPLFSKIMKMENIHNETYMSDFVRQRE